MSSRYIFKCSKMWKIHLKMRKSPTQMACECCHQHHKLTKLGRTKWERLQTCVAKEWQRENRTMQNLSIKLKRHTSISNMMDLQIYFSLLNWPSHHQTHIECPHKVFEILFQSTLEMLFEHCDYFWRMLKCNPCLIQLLIPLLWFLLLSIVICFFLFGFSLFVQ